MKSLIPLLILSCCWGCISTMERVQVVNHSPDRVPDKTEAVILNLDSVHRAVGNSPGIRIMMDAGVIGTIVLDIQVTGMSELAGYEVVQSPHPIATKAATDAIPFMRFGLTPGKDFHPDSLYSVMYRFKYTSLN